jgi:hypothetical protein
MKVRIQWDIINAYEIKIGFHKGKIKYATPWSMRKDIIKSEY